MAVVLAYVDAVPGRLYPLVATLLELAQRGHGVKVRCGIDDVERLRSLGLDAQSLRREIERSSPTTGGRGRASAPSAGSPSVRRASALPAPRPAAGDRGRAA